MICLGTMVNAAAILAGGCVGLVFKKALPRRVGDTVMQGVGLAVVTIGIIGVLGAAFRVDGGGLASDHILLMIISLAAGALTGELVRIEDGLERFSKFCERKWTRQGDTSSFSQGLITATLVFCVGSMSVVGAIEDGINGNTSILFAKATLDGITAMIFASTMGSGVLFSAAVVIVYQGAITLLASVAAPYLNDVVITQISMIGSVLIMGIGLNMLHITKLKVGNLLPAICVPAVWYAIQLLF